MARFPYIDNNSGVLDIDESSRTKGDSLNTKFILYNFQELEEEIEIVMSRIRKGMSHEEYYKSVQHMYHHLNIAWNARESLPEGVADLDDPRMDEWKEFPKDLKLI
ncbi:MAG: hypothetical protein ACKOX6_08440 [Bdellovibrio sp.]